MSKKAKYETLYDMPGHLIRRCHQISVGTFQDLCAEFDLTSIQFAVIWGIWRHPGIDQIQLSGIVGIDRTTIGNVLLRLEKRGIVERAADAQDRRVKRLTLTAKGQTLLAEAAPAVAEVQDRLLAPLKKQERDEFIRLLAKVVNLNNENSRAPVEL